MKIKSTILVCLCCIYIISFSQKLPLALYWTGKTDKAISLAKDIIENKSSFTKDELSNAYDFMAENSLDQAHFENNRIYLDLQFKLKHNTTLDSALYFSRVANYYNCFIMTDSANLYCRKAFAIYNNVKKCNKDSVSVSRFYSYLGNAGRNSFRDIRFLDSAIVYSNNTFLKSLHYRRYATFLTDLIAGLNQKQWKDKKPQKCYANCIFFITKAEELANKIYPDEKSNLHGRIYNIHALAEKYRGNIDKSLIYSDKAKQSIVSKNTVLNNFEYAPLRWILCVA